MDNLDNLVIEIIKKLNGLSMREVKIVLSSVENFANDIGNIDCNSYRFQVELSKDFYQS
ncbi:hypothetical protein [Leptospira wolffii]|uniref:hypothetical protein n=1 Tax=Leptospira wolffii TaxID=409998 RepID=UPI001438616A|nr:hypothetical protein [Leptospira wolffii]